MQGLNAYSRMSDGRLPKGPLHALINESLKLRTDLDLCAQVYGANAKTRGELAQFSPLVSRAAGMGDDTARDIFRRAGQELAGIADALRRRLAFEPGEPVKLSYSGGAFAAGDLLLGPFRDALEATGANFQLVQPVQPPHVGAALYAAKLAGNPDT
jgi:N-acetylglucosamine kinase-like BadF-type ATPase